MEHYRGRSGGGAGFRKTRHQGPGTRRQVSGFKAGCVFEDGREVCRLKLGEVGQNLLLRPFGGEPAKHVPYGDAEAAYAGLAGALAGVNYDSIARPVKIVVP